MKNIFQSAIDNWPEDEAAILIDNWAEAIAEGWTDDEITDGVQKDIAHMVEIFSGESDADDLISRFLTKVGEKFPNAIKNYRLE